jgi:UDP-glucose 6-dehydrogenase
LLVEVLNKKVVVTENGRRCKTTVREAVVTQLINKSATADLRATKMLLDLIKDAEKQTAAATAPEPSPRATAADEQVVEQLIERLRHQIRSEMAAVATNSPHPE